jgi:cysteine synthase
MYYNDNSLSIGNTPLVKLNKVINNKKVTVLAKTEGRNPAYSVKCRIGASMVWEAEKAGLLKPGIEIIESTSGNTGIALAYVGAARGYKVNLTMPDTMSMERRKLLELLGANLILTDGAKGMKGAIDKAIEIKESNPEKYVLLQQFDNPANPLIHEQTTGPEIWEQTEGKIDAIFAGIGTGGTISGITKFIKNTKKKQILSIGIEPADSPVITQYLNKEKLVPGPHKIQGIGAGFIPKNLDLDLVDKIITVKNDEAIDFAKRLAKEEGILAGFSSGAAVAAINKFLDENDFEGKTIVVILPDSGERYLSAGIV